MSFHHLPHNAQRRILDHVHRDMATFRTAQPEDIARFAVEAYIDVYGEDERLAAFDAGIAQATEQQGQRRVS